MSVITINKNNFREEVLCSDKPVLLDFWASWCGPCKMLAPVFEEVEKEKPSVFFGKINVDDEQELAYKFGISSIPTIIFMKNGKAVNKAVGYMPKEELLALIEEAE